MDFDTLWKTYPMDLCSRKGSKKEALKSYDKLMKGLEAEEAEKMHSKILTGLREWMRYDRSEVKQNRFVPKWPMVSTWLNQERFELDDIPQSGDKPESTARECKCGKPVAVGRLCNDCYDEVHPDPWEKDRKERLSSLGILRGCKNKQDVIEACKNYNRQSGIMERTLKVGASGSEGNL